jgi:hypothetical protein
MKEYKELLKLSYYVPVAKEKPPSLLFIGVPGVGKSHLLVNNRASNCMILSDMTAAGIETVLEKFDKDPEFHFIVCPDIITALTRRAKRFTSFINMALEEGVRSILRKDVSFQTRNGGAHIGIIAAVTSGEFKVNISMLRSTGFLSRSLLINFDPDVTDIAKQMAGGESSPGEEIQIERGKLFDVPISTEARDVILAVGTSWAREEGEKPLRKIGIIRKYARARALIRHMETGTELRVLKEDPEYVWKVIRQTKYRIGTGSNDFRTRQLEPEDYDRPKFDTPVRRVESVHPKWRNKSRE